MPNIGNYTATTEWILWEAGKYFVLLLFSVLAIRLWRRWTKMSAANKHGYLLLALTATSLAIVIGYFSMCHSMGKLYSYYGMKAFHTGRLPEALSLFETSGKFWNDADAAGERGVCLLLSGNASDGERLIQKAKAMRKGKGVPFEEFYEGIYFFTQGERNKAVPLLQAATVDSQFRWSVVKIFSVMALDDGRPKDAAEQMKPYKDAEITQFDQAYIMASLKLADGKSDEAKTILKKFPAQNLSPAWKKRFEKLQEQIQK